jgi:NADPH-dependent 2,4-dienoyl-CoA reductase/sulfur reductase-like enzyme
VIPRRGFLAGATALLLPRPGRAAGITPSIAIVGGGIAGSSAAFALRRHLPQARITLFDPLPQYHACYGSNHVLAGWLDDDALIFGRDGLRRAGIAFVPQAITMIERQAGALRLIGDGMRESVDHVILAAGIQQRPPAYGGYDPAAMPAHWTAAERIAPLRDRLDALADGASIVMIVPAAPYRCPPAPYERATAMAARLKARGRRGRITILDAKTSFPKQALFEDAWARLYPGMIDWLPVDVTGPVTAIDAGARTVITASDRFRYDLLHVIPPQQAAAVVVDAGLADATGWIPVSGAAFRSPRDSRVTVLGDAIIAGDMPKSAFAANAQARLAAASLAAEWQGREPPPADLFNTCYSRLAEGEAVMVGGPFELVDGKIKARPGFISRVGESAAQRRRQCDEAIAWIGEFSRQVFDG